VRKEKKRQEPEPREGGRENGNRDEQQREIVAPHNWCSEERDHDREREGGGVTLTRRRNGRDPGERQYDQEHLRRQLRRPVIHEYRVHGHRPAAPHVGDGREQTRILGHSVEADHRPRHEKEQDARTPTDHRSAAPTGEPQPRNERPQKQLRRDEQSDDQSSDDRTVPPVPYACHAQTEEQ